MLSIDTDFPAGGHEAITIASPTGGIGFTAALITAAGAGVNKDAKEVFCSLETANMRFTLDGTTVSSTVGHTLASGETLTLKNRSDIVNFRAIKFSTDASLRCTYRY